MKIHFYLAAGLLAAVFANSLSVICRDTPAVALQASPLTVLEKIETACRQASRLNFAVNLPLPTEGEITGIDLILLSDTKDIQKNMLKKR